ncbi:hypothetical protein AMTRI_Chr04g188030 [Amborella trichopoda]|uniref:Peptidase A1 domain-containing protein n=1 Tax=Amborella trichopoda TaxID=13333 RepID=W1NFU6_AMBTC|nr:aspartyl protease family protein 2 [Amborella trichopoda]ERM94069.1 hypothetical protein AMTR_s00010p00081970 [Amborella trichopoda]|eukprot:XP_006826832.1 aspartyl protease family protein 2 [Amborella trichopoda]
MAPLSHLILLSLVLTLAPTPSKPEPLKLTLFRTPSLPHHSDSLLLASLFRGRRHPGLSVPVVSGAPFGSGQYFAHLRVGSPPQTLTLVTDTGSDLIWLKCSPCRNCSHHKPNSAFFFRHSASFSLVHCYSSACSLLPPPPHSHCNHTRLHSPCRYKYTYGDSSVSEGFFSTETATMNTSSGREAQVPGIAFGCGFEASGPSLSGPSFSGAVGVLGLGRGAVSFASQAGRSTFSYCLADYTDAPPLSSYLLLGPHEPTKPMSFTPIITNPLAPTFYYVAIEKVSVQGRSLEIEPSVWAVDSEGNGGTVIDSGTTLSFLVEPAYRKILAAFEERVGKKERVPKVQSFDLCVNASGEVKLPTLKLGLKGGAVMAPPPSNYFLEVEPGVKCLAIQSVPRADGFSILGNLFQQGFLFVFDNERSRLGFSQTGCAS